MRLAWSRPYCCVIDALGRKSNPSKKERTFNGRIQLAALKSAAETFPMRIPPCWAKMTVRVSDSRSGERTEDRIGLRLPGPRTACCDSF